jgi:acetyl-CoA carboxylase beta subunit
MSKVIGARRAPSDYFEPDDEVDPKAQRALRGQLEQIDYAAYAANKKLLSGAMGAIEAGRIQKLASAAALARTRWVVAALSISESGDAPTREQVAGLAHLRATYEELAGAYDGLRRMVERGYIGYTPAAG